MNKGSGGWRFSRWLILVEFVLVLLIYLADSYHWHHVIVFSKTLYLLALGWLSLWLRGLGWKDIGMHSIAVGDARWRSGRRLVSGLKLWSYSSPSPFWFD
jgi:hypothetical protein